MRSVEDERARVQRELFLMSRLGFRPEEIASISELLPLVADITRDGMQRAQGLPRGLPSIHTPGGSRQRAKSANPRPAVSARPPAALLRPPAAFRNPQLEALALSPRRPTTAAPKEQSPLARRRQPGSPRTVQYAESRRQSAWQSPPRDPLLQAAIAQGARAPTKVGA